MLRSRGFTLVELMVTVAVLAILATLAAPSFSSFFQRYRLRGAADDVVSLLATSRAEAMMRNRNVAVVFAGSGTNWCVGAVAAPEPVTPGQSVTTTPSCTCNNDCTIGGRVMERHGSDYSGVSLAATPATTTLVFDRLTGAIQPIGGTTATFNSPDGAYALTLQVSALGRGRLCVPSGSPPMSGFQSC